VKRQKQALGSVLFGQREYGLAKRNASRGRAEAWPSAVPEEIHPRREIEISARLEASRQLAQVRRGDVHMAFPAAEAQKVALVSEIQKPLGPLIELILYGRYL
jgi:hypothetical protein